MSWLSEEHKPIKIIEINMFNTTENIHNSWIIQNINNKVTTLVPQNYYPIKALNQNKSLIITLNKKAFPSVTNQSMTPDSTK